MWKGQVLCNPGPFPYQKALQQMGPYRGPRNFQEAGVDCLQQAHQISPTRSLPPPSAPTLYQHREEDEDPKTAASSGGQHRYAFCNTFTFFPHFETQVDSGTLKVNCHPKSLLSNFALPTKEGIGTRAVEIRQTHNHPETLEEDTVTFIPEQLSTSLKMCKDHLDAPLAAAWALARGEPRRLVSARNLDYTADNCEYQVSRQHSNSPRHPLLRPICFHQDDRHCLRRKPDLPAEPVGWNALCRVSSAYRNHWTFDGIPPFRGHLHRATHNRYVCSHLQWAFRRLLCSCNGLLISTKTGTKLASLQSFWGKGAGHRRKHWWNWAMRSPGLRPKIADHVSHEPLLRPERRPQLYWRHDDHPRYQGDQGRRGDPPELSLNDG